MENQDSRKSCVESIVRKSDVLTQKLLEVINPVHGGEEMAAVLITLDTIKELIAKQDPEVAGVAEFIKTHFTRQTGGVITARADAPESIINQLKNIKVKEEK